MEFRFGMPLLVRPACVPLNDTTVQIIDDDLYTSLLVNGCPDLREGQDIEEWLKYHGYGVLSSPGIRSKALGDTEAMAKGLIDQLLDAYRDNDAIAATNSIERMLGFLEIAAPHMKSALRLYRTILLRARPQFVLKVPLDAGKEPTNERFPGTRILDSTDPPE